MLLSEISKIGSVLLDAYRRFRLTPGPKVSKKYEKSNFLVSSLNVWICRLTWCTASWGIRKNVTYSVRVMFDAVTDDKHRHLFTKISLFSNIYHSRRTEVNGQLLLTGK